MDDDYQTLLYAKARPDEWFFYSRWCPRMLAHVNLGLIKATIWVPWPFVSLAAGWLLTSGRKAHPWQFYLGIKCDGSRTRDCNPQAWVNGDRNNLDEDKIERWVMVLTPKPRYLFTRKWETIALRHRWLNYNQTWDNGPGA